VILGAAIGFDQGRLAFGLGFAMEGEVARGFLEQGDGGFVVAAIDGREAGFKLLLWCGPLEAHNQTFC
jgi:hypothetical protein